MRFDKQQILSMISDPAQAEQAAQHLPDTLDHEEHGELLQRFGVDPNQLPGSSGGQAAGAEQGQFQESGSGYGGQESGSGYGGQESGSGYGGQESGSGYGGQESGSGYGGQESGSGYGGQESGSGYGGEADQPQTGDEGQTGSGAF